MNTTLEKLHQFGIVPVVVLDDAKDAAPLAKALCSGGLACAEVTFRTEAAEESIRIMAQEFPEMIVGAGTVLTIEQVDRAVNAGAKFIVTPGFDPEIVAYCQEKEIPITPGVVTPSEMAQAVKFGLDIVKFFPAEPSGGLNPQNVGSYLQYDRIFACGGSWMVKSSLIDAGDFEQITALTKEAVELVQKYREV